MRSTAAAINGEPDAVEQVHASEFVGGVASGEPDLLAGRHRWETSCHRCPASRCFSAMPVMPPISNFSSSELECVSVCPYCRGAEAVDLFVEQGFPYVQCSACSLIYLRIRVKPEFVHRIYDGPYHSSNNVPYARVQARKRLALVGALRPGARVVEDGAGNGAFVRAAIDAGYDAMGCDLGKSSIELAKTLFDVPLVHGPLEALGLADASVDLLVSFNLLSHLYQPWSYIKTVARLLAPGGRWLCRTGDRSHVMAWVGRGHWSAPEHVFHFTGPLLQRMVREAGLEWLWQRPAFDSDFPYAFIRYSRPATTRLRRVAALTSSVLIRSWTACRLPKEDIFFLAERPASA